MLNARLLSSPTEVDRRQVLMTGAGLLYGAASNASAQSRIAGTSDAAINLAAIIDLSGPISNQSRVGFAGAQLYFHSLNNGAGVHGRQVHLRLLDDGFDPVQSVRVANELYIDQSAFAIFGSVGDSSAASLVPLMERLRFPYFGPIAGVSAIRKNKKYTFFFRPSYKTEAVGIFRHAISSKTSAIAFIYQKNSFGLSILEEIKVAAESVPGIRLATAIGIDDEASLANACRHIEDSGVKAVVVGAVGTMFADIVRSLKKQLSGIPYIYGFSVVSPQEIFDYLGPIGRGVIISQCMPSLSRSAIPLVNEYRSVHLNANLPFPPNSFTFEGFAMAKLFVEALRISGRSLTQERFVQALESMQNVNLDGFRISIPKEDHTASSFTDLAIVDRYGRLQY